jgi:PGF-pre-PGF domain-containing protein
MKINKVVFRSIFILLVLTFIFAISFLVNALTYYEIPVNSLSPGFNLTIYVNETGTSTRIENATVYLLNDTNNSLYYYNDLAFYGNTSPTGNITFFNLTPGIYGINFTAPGYLPDEFRPINIVASNLTYTISMANDTSSPSIIWNTPSNNTVKSFSSQTFSFSVSDNVDTNLNLSLYVNGVYNQSKLGYGISSFDNVPIPVSGIYLFNITAKDDAGNIANSGVYNISYDYLNPEYLNYNISTWVDSNTNGTQNASYPVYFWSTLNGTYSKITSATLIVNTSNGYYNTQVNNTLASDVVSLYNFSFSLPSQALYPPGTIFEFRINFTDQVGYNNITPPLFVELTDNSSPIVTNVDIFNGLNESRQVFGPNQTIYFNVTAIDNYDNLTNINMTIYNSSGIVRNTFYNTTEYLSDDKFLFQNLTPNQQGNYSLNITTQDVYGNIGSFTNDWFVVDLESPIITDINASWLYGKYGTSIKLLVNVSDNFNISLSDYIVTASSNGTTTQILSYIGNNHWEGDITINSLLDYNNYINISVVDVNGNTTYDNSFNITIDNTSPTLNTDYNNSVTKTSYVYGDSTFYDYYFNYTSSELLNSSDLRVNYNYSFTNLPLGLNNSYLINMSYPGKYFLNLTAFDLAGNQQNLLKTIYADFLFDSDNWIRRINNSNSNVNSIQVYNSSRNESLNGNINISSNSLYSELDLIVNFSDSKKLLFDDVSVLTSFTNFSPSWSISNSYFENLFSEIYEKNPVDYILFDSPNSLDYDSISANMTYNYSEINNIFYCELNNNVGHLYCYDLDQTSSNVYSYQNNTNGIIMNYNQAPSSLNVDYNLSYIFVLANDTISPRLYSTDIDSINNSVRTSVASFDFSVYSNEILSNCSYYSSNQSLIPNSSYDSLTKNSIYTFNSSYDYLVYNYTFNIPTIKNGSYNITLNCSDKMGNYTSVRFNFTISDNSEPSISSISPNNQTSYTSTGSKTLYVTTNEESYCVLNRNTDFSNFNDGIHMSTSNNLTHSFSWTVSQTANFPFYVKCKNINNQITNKSYNIYHSASINEGSSSSSSSSSGGGGISSGGTTSGFYITRSNFANPVKSSDENLVYEFDIARVDLYKIIFDLVEPINSTNLQIESFNEANHLLGYESDAPADIYRYFRLIPSSNLNDDVFETVTYSFRVSNDWLNEMEYSYNNIEINKFVNNKWTSESVKYLGNDTDYSYYEVVSDSIALYAISAKSSNNLLGLSSTTNPTQITNQSNSSSSNQNQGSSQSSQSTYVDGQQGTIVDSIGSQIDKITKSNLSGRDIGMIIFIIFMLGLALFLFYLKNKQKIQSGGLSEMAKEQSDKFKESLTALTGKDYNGSESLKKPIFKKEKNKQNSLENNLLQNAEKDAKAVPNLSQDIDESFNHFGEDVSLLLNKIKQVKEKDPNFDKSTFKLALMKKGWPGMIIDHAYLKLDEDELYPVKTDDFLIEQTLSSLGSTDAKKDLENLKNYILNAKKAGMTKDSIKQELLKNNWDETIVYQSIEQYY